MADGLWLSRKQPKTFHQPRLRRERFGELVQIDGSDHRWFEDRGEPCTLSYDRKRIILERNTLSEGLKGKEVDVYDFPDGRLEVRSKGLLLPYRVFSKDQRVSHTAIVENKRLGHALALIRAQQDTSFTPKVNTNSQKLGYEKRGRNVYGPDYIKPGTPI